MNKRKGNGEKAAWGKTLLLAVVLLAMMAVTALGNDGISVFVDGVEIDYGDSSPKVINERVMVGVRYLALALGVPNDGILWDGPSQTVMLTKDDTVIILAIGNPNMIVNDSYVEMDTTPAISNGRIYLPARYVSEALGFSVSWDAQNSAVLISSTGTQPEYNDDYNNNDYDNPDAAMLIGSWTDLSQAATGSLVDPATGFADGTYFSGQWYFFDPDGTCRYVIIGQGTIISGMAEVLSNWRVADDQIIFTNQVQNFTPFPQDTVHQAVHGESLDDETQNFSYDSSDDTMSIDGVSTFHRIQY